MSDSNIISTASSSRIDRVTSRDDCLTWISVLRVELRRKHFESKLQLFAFQPPETGSLTRGVLEVARLVGCA
jgi:hypothetical protein